MFIQLGDILSKAFKFLLTGTWDIFLGPTEETSGQRNEEARQ